MGESLEDYFSHDQFYVSGKLDIHDHRLLYAVGQRGNRKDIYCDDAADGIRFCVSYVLDLFPDRDSLCGHQLADHLKEGLLL